ncbi:MAG: type II toxin-antitoxin system VapC family toxin [Phycisphaerales bacterium]|nr:type II toxin-antitoxin system VapC family toxin [Phycisphaerales bacterium]
MSVLLDTNICIEMIRGRAPEVVARLRRRKIGTVGISAITVAELICGVAKSTDPARNRVALAHFCAPLEICPFDHAAATSYGELRSTLERAGTPIGPLDTLIAAHAAALDVALVTNNEREFRRVSGLRVENWLKSP